MKSFPIYNEVEACIYKSKNLMELKILLNQLFMWVLAKEFTWISNSNYNKKRKEHERHGSIIEFATSFDGVILKRMIFKNEKGIAGRYILTETKMDKLKSIWKKI